MDRDRYRDAEAATRTAKPWTPEEADILRPYTGEANDVIGGWLALIEAGYWRTRNAVGIHMRLMREAGGE